MMKIDYKELHKEWWRKFSPRDVLKGRGEIKESPDRGTWNERKLYRSRRAGQYRQESKKQ